MIKNQEGFGETLSDFFVKDLCTFVKTNAF